MDSEELTNKVVENIAEGLERTTGKNGNEPYRPDAFGKFLELSREYQKEAWELSKYSELAFHLREAKRLAVEVQEEVSKINFDFSFLERM